MLWFKLDAHLKKGEERKFRENIGKLSSGWHTITLKADNNNAINESNENNNIKTLQVQVHKEPNPDITVVSINYPIRVTEGQNMIVRYGLKNIGQRNFAGNLCDSVRVYTSDGRLITHKSNCKYEGSFGPNHYRTREVNFQAPVTGSYRVEVKTDFNSQWREQNEANNQRVAYFWSSAITPVATYRFYHNSMGAHLFKTNRDYVSGGWNYAGRSFKAFPVQKPGTVPIYACWNDRFRTHRYSRFWSYAKDGCSSNPWIAFYEYPNGGAGRKPVRQMWHPIRQVYIYSNGEQDANNLVKYHGFQKHGIAWYAPN